MCCTQFEENTPKERSVKVFTAMNDFDWVFHNIIVKNRGPLGPLTCCLWLQASNNPPQSRSAFELRPPTQKVRIGWSQATFFWGGWWGAAGEGGEGVHGYASQRAAQHPSFEGDMYWNRFCTEVVFHIPLQLDPTCARQSLISGAYSTKT